MDARQLEYFLAIVNHDGPSLSQSIANLERELGVQLFHRIGRTAVLSTAGSELVEPARQVLRDLRTARATVDSGTRSCLCRRTRREACRSWGCPSARRPAVAQQVDLGEVLVHPDRVEHRQDR